jgi:hypothetical protein
MDPESWMRLTRVSLVVATALPLAVAAVAQSSLALSVVGDFSHPQHADDAIFSPDGRVLA